MLVNVLLIAFLTLLINDVRGEVFTAVTDLEPLVETHRSVINSIEEYLEAETEKMNTLRKYLKSYKKEQEIMLNNTPSYVGNPMNIFTLIKRLTVDFKYLEDISKAELKKAPAMIFPTSEDLDGTVIALSRLQNTYGLNVDQLALGVLNGTFSHENKRFIEKTIPLSASDCFEIGRILNVYKDYGKALDWLFQALVKVYKDDNRGYHIEETDIVDVIRDTYHKLDDFKNAFIWTKKLLTMKPEEQTVLEPFLKSYESRIATEFQVGNAEDQAFKSEEAVPHRADYIYKYEALCRGEVPVAASKAKSLRCYYTATPNSFLRLARIKTEQLHLDPAVIMFYDVINESELQPIRALAKPKLQRSKVYGSSFGEQLVTQIRTSKSGSLDDSDEDVARLSLRISLFSGLRTGADSAEVLQVANYGIGGHYEPHYDFIEPDHLKETNEGNRLATALFYMSDVEQGGATVFIDLDLTVFPVRRAAVFWYNLLPSGERDFRTRHAACPVLLGSKWVCTKWIRATNQELNKPCTLEDQKLFS